jgi:hypothetical protein
MLFKQFKEYPIIINTGNLLNEVKSAPVFKHLIKHPVVVVLIFASILRFWGIWHGYPFSYYPDEQHFVNRAVSFGSGDLNPHWFHKPAFLMYILFFEYGLFFVLGKFMGMFSTADGFAVYYFQDTWPFILIGRITVTIFGIATIYVVYKIGERFWSKTAGLCCAILLTLSYGHIFCGQDVKADVPTTFFATLSIYFLLKLVNNNSFNNKDYILAGLFAGLGTATKYYLIVFLPCILIASIYEVINRRNIFLFKKYLYSLLGFWGTFLIVSPYNFLDPLGRRWTFQGIIAVYNKISPFKLYLYSPVEGEVINKGEGHFIFNSFIHYLKVMLSTEGVGIIIGIIFIISICCMVFKPTLKKFVLLSFPILFSIISIVMNPSYTEPRHQLVIYPFLSVVAGIFLYELSKKFTNKSKVVIVLTILLIFPTVSIIKNNLLISRTDTRTLAKYWIESNIPSDTKILLDELSPKLKMNKENLDAYYEKSKLLESGQFTTHLTKYYNYQLQALSGITYDIKEIRHIWWRDKEIESGESDGVTEYDKDMANTIKTVGINDYEFYVNSGYKYVVTSKKAYGAYIKPDSRKSMNFPSYKKFYDNLFSKGKLVKEFNPKEIGLPGPLVQVFKL